VPPADSTRRGNWPAALLCGFALWALAPLRSTLFALHAYSLAGMTPAAPHRWDFLPACVWLLLAVTGRAPTLQRRLTWGCLIWSSGALAVHATAGNLSPTDVLAGVALVVAWSTARWQPSTTLLARLAPLGTISFGLYAVTMPIQFAQRRLLPDLAGTPLTFALRLMLMLVLAGALSWVLERRLYPACRRWFLSERAGNFPRETSLSTNPSA
jgi:hypothetical protein